MLLMGLFTKESFHVFRLADPIFGVREPTLTRAGRLRDFLTRRRFGRPVREAQANTRLETVKNETLPLTAREGAHFELITTFDGSPQATESRTIMEGLL